MTIGAPVGANSHVHLDLRSPTEAWTYDLDTEVPSGMFGFLTEEVGASFEYLYKTSPQ